MRIKNKKERNITLNSLITDSYFIKVLVTLKTPQRHVAFCNKIIPYLAVRNNNKN